MKAAVCLYCCHLVCSEAAEDVSKNSKKRLVVLTICGHLYHLDCLEAALVIQRSQADGTASLSRRKDCPYIRCQKDLRKTVLTYVNFPDVDVKYSDEEENQLVRLRKENEDLQMENNVLKIQIERLQIEKEKQECAILEGSKIYWKGHKDECYRPGTVVQLLAKVKVDDETPETDPCVCSKMKSRRNSFRTKMLQLPFGAEQNVPLKDVISQKDYLRYLPDGGGSASCRYRRRSEGNHTTSPNSPQNYWNTPISELHNQRAKWNAGDRIFLSEENEYARIKWIGSRDYKFYAALEFDQPVGDNSLEGMDIPITFKKGYNRKVSIDELNNIAVKISDDLFSPTRNSGGLFAGLRFKSHRKKMQRSTTFYISDSQPDPDLPSTKVKKRSFSISIPLQNTTNSLNSIKKETP